MPKDDLANVPALRLGVVVLDQQKLGARPASDWLRRARAFALSDGGLPIVWLALTVLVLIPVWRPRMLAMLDIPNHLALASAWHHFKDPAFRISEFYALRIRPVPYFLYYFVIHLLLYVTSIEHANKIFLSGYLIFFPLSILTLARALKRPPWLAVAAFALAFNQNWIYGFASYLGATCFMFFAMAALLRYLYDGRPRDVALLLALSFLTYFGHILPWFCLGLTALALFITHRRNHRRVLVAGLALLPSLILAVVTILQDRAESSYIRAGEGWVAMFKSFPEAILEIPRRVMEIFPGPMDYVVLATIAVTTLGLLIWRGTKIEGAETQRRDLFILLMLFLVIYVSLPCNVRQPISWWNISQRIPSLLAPMLLLLPAVKLRRWQRLLLIPMLAAVVYLPIKLTNLYLGFSKRNEAFMRLVAELPEGSSTLVVFRGMLAHAPGADPAETSGDPATSAPVYWHFASWPTAFHGGYDAEVFDQGIPVRPIKRLEAPTWNMFDQFTLRSAPRFDYYLVRYAPVEFLFEPSLKLEAQNGDWSLYRRVADLTDEP